MNNSFDDTVNSDSSGDFDNIFEEDIDFYGLLKSLADQWETLIPKSVADDKKSKESRALRKRPESGDPKSRRSSDENESGSSQYGPGGDPDWDDMENSDLFRASDSVSLEDIQALRKRVQEGENHYASELAYALIHYSANLENHLSLEEALAMLDEAYQLFYELYQAGEPEYLLDCGKIMLQKTGMYLMLSNKSGDDFSMDIMNESLAWIQKYRTELSSDDYLWLSAEAVRIQGHCFGRRNMYNSAITSLLQSETIWAELVDSGNLQCRDRQAETAYTTGIMYANIGDMVQAKNSLIRSIEMWNPLVDEDPANLSEQINVYCVLARVCMVREELLEVEKYLDIAFDLLNSLKELNWEKYISAAVDLYGIRAELQNNNNDYENELDTLEELNQIYMGASHLKEKDCSLEDIEKDCRFYMWLHERRGITLCVLRRMEDALAAYTRSLRFVIDGRKRSGMDINDHLLRLVFNVNWLFQLQGKNDDAIQIVQLVVDLFEKDKTTDQETRQYILSVLYHQYAKLLLNAERRELAFEMYNHAIAFLDAEPDRIPANHEMEAICERATEFSFRELDSEKALSDLANLSSILEYDIDENDYSKLVLYITIVQGQANILNHLELFQKSLDLLQNAGQRLLTILEKGHFKHLDYFHNLLVDWIASREMVFCREEALVLCKEIIQRFRDIQKPYTSEVPLSDSLHNPEFMASLSRVPLKELRFQTRMETELTPAEQEKISAIAGSVSPDLLLRQKKYIADLFENNILSLSILRLRIGNTIDESETIVNQLRAIIDKKMERFRMERYEIGGETLFFIQNYVTIMVQCDNSLMAMAQLKRWIEAASLTPEGDIDPTFNPEVRSLFSIMENFLQNNSGLDPDEVIALWNHALEWCLTCFRNGAIQAGFEYGKIAGNKCLYLETVDRKDECLPILVKACQVLELASRNGHSEAKHEWGKLLFRQGQLLEDDNAEEVKTLYLQAYDHLRSNEEGGITPEICWYLGKVTYRLGIITAADNVIEQTRHYFRESINHFKSLIHLQPGGEHEDELLDVYNQLSLFCQYKNFPALEDEMGDILQFLYDNMSKMPREYMIAHYSWYLYLGIFGLSFINRQATFPTGLAIISLIDSVFDPLPENCPEGMAHQKIAFKILESYYLIQQCEPERARGLIDQCELWLADTPNAGTEQGFFLFVELIALKIGCLNNLYEYTKSQKFYCTYEENIKEAFDSLQERKREEPGNDYSDLEDSYARFLVHGALAVAYHGDYDKAAGMIAYVLQSIQTDDLPNLMSSDLLAFTLTSRAHVAMLQQDYEVALECSALAIEQYRSSDFHRNQYYTDISVAEPIRIQAVSLGKTGQSEKALELCDQLIKTQDQYWETDANIIREDRAKTLMIYGEILKNLGQKSKANEAFDQAKAIVQALISQGEKHQKHLLNTIKKLR